MSKYLWILLFQMLLQIYLFNNWHTHCVYFSTQAYMYMWKCSDICAVLCVVTVFRYLFVWTFARHTVCTFPHMYMWYRYMCSCVLCVVNESAHLPYTLCLHTLHIVCCKCLQNLFMHISLHGHLPHRVISIHVDFKYFVQKEKYIRNTVPQFNSCGYVILKSFL